MAITGFYREVDGIKTYFETNDGPADRATLICLHTAGRDGRQFHQLMELLEDRYRVVAIDGPAHGKSWPLKGNKAIKDYRQFCAFIWDAVQTLGVQNPIMVGCSMCGSMVYYMAQEYPVRAIVSMQGCDYTDSINDSIIELLNHPYISVQHSHLEINECLIGSACPPEVREFIIWGIRQEIGVTKEGDLTMYNTFDVRGEMDKVTCPVLVVHGTFDALVSEDMVEETMRRAVNAKCVRYRPVPDCGHFVMMENAPEVARHIDEFIREEL